MKAQKVLREKVQFSLKRSLQTEQNSLHKHLNFKNHNEHSDKQKKKNHKKKLSMFEDQSFKKQY